MIVDGKSTTDVRFMFAAYVNEQHPFVEKVLREALDDGIVDSFSGYVIISVAAARRHGILPIAFRSDSKFTPVPAAEDSSDDDSNDDSESDRK
jgi:hypothetical protein